MQRIQQMDDGVAGAALVGAGGLGTILQVATAWANIFATWGNAALIVGGMVLLYYKIKSSRRRDRREEDEEEERAQ